ncbi:hypothetical protein F6J84_03885 [Microbacterium caowuchunii]|nr:hypothetical protein F6J84_03885 [Microbacterium caowuchunii]
MPSPAASADSPPRHGCGSAASSPRSRAATSRYARRRRSCASWPSDCAPSGASTRHSGDRTAGSSSPPGARSAAESLSPSRPRPVPADESRVSPTTAAEPPEPNRHGVDKLPPTGR